MTPTKRWAMFTANSRVWNELKCYQVIKQFTWMNRLWWPLIAGWPSGTPVLVWCPSSHKQHSAWCLASLQRSYKRSPDEYVQLSHSWLSYQVCLLILHNSMVLLSLMSRKLCQQCMWIYMETSEALQFLKIKTHNPHLSLLAFIYALKLSGLGSCEQLSLSSF